MTLRLRAAEPRDMASITSLLLQDAATRESLNADLWSVPPDAAARVQASLSTITEPITGPFRHHWIVAEADGTLLGVVHGMNVPAPPLFDLGGGTAGVLLDDCHLSLDEAVSAALLRAAEQALTDAGAVLFVAASPADWTDRTSLLETAGYETTTLYMVKAGLSEATPSKAVRPAMSGDLRGIVRLSALHRRQLEAASPIFWNVHSKADERFASWMEMTLTLRDRTMFVAGAAGSVEGFIIAQPGSPLHLPPAHDLTRIGLIDDFHVLAFESDWKAGDPDGEPSALLAAAESVLHARGANVALAICPARMARKVELLMAEGYASANLWMVKTGSVR